VREKSRRPHHSPEQTSPEKEQRIVELQRVRDGLAQLVASCPGHGKPEDCPILRALADDEAKP